MAYVRRMSATIFNVCSPYVHRMSAVCLSYVRRMFAVCPPKIRHISAVCPPYVIPNRPFSRRNNKGSLEEAATSQQAIHRGRRPGLCSVVFLHTSTVWLKPGLVACLAKNKSYLKPLLSYTLRRGNIFLDLHIMCFLIGWNDEFRLCDDHLCH